MKIPYILGLKKSIPEAPFMSTVELNDAVGHDTGNLAFHYAISRHLGNGLESIGWDATHNQIDAMGNLAILPCANQLGPHANFGNLSMKFAKLNSRMVAIGLGAQSDVAGKIPDVPDGTIGCTRRHDRLVAFNYR